MKKAIVIFRNNNWLKTLLSMIAAVIESLGFEVETKIFPEWNDKDDIRDWVMKNAEILSNKLVVMDNTCVSWEIQSQSEKTGSKFIYLYEILLASTFQTIFGKEISYKEINRGRTNGLSGMILREIFSRIKKEFIPESVDVISTSFNDHDNLPVNELKDILVDCGFQSVRVMDADGWWKIGRDRFAHMKDETIQEYDRPNTWAIADLHVSHIFSKSFHQAKIVEYPVSALARCLIENNMIEIDHDKLAIDFKQVLKNEIEGGGVNKK